MAATTIARKHRRTGKVRGSKKLTMVGAAAATATAMTVGMASPGMTPAANALTLNADATTTGPLLWALNVLGVDNVNLEVAPGVTLDANLAYLPSEPVGLYDAINAAPFTRLLATFTRPNGVGIPFGATIAPLLIADGLGVFGSRSAYSALLASAGGNTPAGYTPLANPGLVNTITGNTCTNPSATCVQGTNVTNLAMLLVDNPFTPNGGIVARFPFAAGFLGVDTTTPTGQSASSTGIRFNGGVINVALGYNPGADFPASANPFSVANSVTAGLLPTYLLGGISSVGGADVNSIVLSLTSLLTLGTPFTSYSTIVPNDLPFMEPLRLTARLFNLVSYALGSDLRLSTPLADALQPAFEILVNTGYTDVVTPSEGGTYNRTYDKSAVNTPFRTEAPLTLKESLAVPGDVLNALWTGTVASVQNLIANGFFYRSSGLLEPAAAVPAPTAAVPAPAAATPAAVQPPAASSFSEVKSDEGSEGSFSDGTSVASDQGNNPAGPDVQDLKSPADPSPAADASPTTDPSPTADPSPTTGRTGAAEQSDDDGGPDANAQRPTRRGAGSGDSSKRDHSSRRAA